MRVKGASGRTAMGKPNQLGSDLGVASGRMKYSSRSLSPSYKGLKIVAPRFNKSGQLFQLCHAHRRLHVSQLQVIANVRVDILMVIAIGKSPNCHSKRLPQVLSLPGSHQQSRPQSRNDSTSVLSKDWLVSTQPPSPIVMWCAG